MSAGGEDLDALTAAADEARRVTQLLRDARSALRKVDVLAATAMAAEDDSVGTIAEARAAMERVVREFERRQLTASRQQRRMDR